MRVAGAGDDKNVFPAVLALRGYFPKSLIVPRGVIIKDAPQPLAAQIFFQTFINISVATGLMPNTGITLPFVSYGLTSLVSFCIGIGFVLNVGLQTRRY